jgi:hypothetical protein
MAGFDIGGLAGLVPGGAQFTRIAGDVLDIGKALLGVPAEQAKPAAQPPAANDAFQPAAQQQGAAAGGGNQQITQALNQIMQVLTELTNLLGGKGNQQQQAVGTGGAGAPAQQGGAAPAGGAAPQGGAAPAGGAAPQGGAAPTAGAQAQGGVNGNLALHGTGLILQGMGELLQAISQGGPSVGQPDPAQSGGVSTSAGSSAVTTSGGYKIESTGPTAWEITGPDGKKTKIDGDPHVHEGDGQNWDFKKDSTFVLGDGTRINVGTKDLGNGTSVSDKLEIMQNGQRAVMTGLADGKGKVETVDRGAEQLHTDQTFVMGKETDDWAIGGKEILGNDGGVDKFKTGNTLDTTQAAAQAGAAAGAAAGGANGAGGAAPAGGAQQQGGLAGLLQQIQQIIAGLTGQGAAQAQPAQGAGGAAPAQQPAQNQPAQGANNAQQTQQQKPADVLSQLLTSIVGMLQALLPLLTQGLGKGGPVAG